MISMKTIYSFFSCILFFLPAAFAQQETFADHWEFVGIAVEEPGFTIWGTSPVMGEDGKVHLYVARWLMADDIARFAGPSGDLKGEITSYTWIDDRTLEVQFQPQSVVGAYEMGLGPNITDATATALSRSPAPT